MSKTHTAKNNQSYSTLLVWKYTKDTMKLKWEARANEPIFVFRFR